MRYLCAIIAAWTSVAAVAGNVRAYTPTRWIGDAVAVPEGVRGAEVAATFVDGGGEEVQLFLRQFDAAGKPVGDCSAAPRMPPLAPSLRGKPWTFTAVVEGAKLRPGAVTVRPIAVVGEERRSGKAFEMRDLSVNWRTTPVSDKLANWVSVGETITFTGAFPPGRNGLRAVVVDSAGRVVADDRVAARSWRWRTDRPGYYEVCFDWLDATNAAARSAETLFASDVRAQADGTRCLERFGAFPRDRQAIVVTPRGPVAPEQASSAFGFHLSLNAGSEFYRRTQFALIKLLGMSAFMRAQHVGWYKVERAKGVYDWKDVDAFFQCAEDAGFPLSRQIVGIFGTPTWNTTATDLSFGPFKGPHMYAPKDLAPWRDFVAAVVRRYPGLERIEIWNEPHLPGYSVFWRESSPEQFVDLMKAAYGAAKGVRPDITVFMGGIGMRYLPFYERVAALGIVSHFDQLATHCGYDMRAFRDCERRLGVPSKPYFEDEWHTVLYNCTQTDRPDEDGCSYRMLRNLATLLHEGNAHVTGFGLTCGDHTPETADFFAAAGGIQQVCGLFRDKPFLEPRRAALALRTATDRFRGTVRKVGAWCFGEDGAQVAVVFASEARPVAFVWNENPRRPDWNPVLTGAGGRVIDWEGRGTAWTNVPPKTVCFVENVDCARLARGGHAVDRLGFFGAGNAKPRPVEDGVYADARAARPNVMTNGALDCAFSAALSERQLSVDLKGACPLHEVRLALDVEGRGDIDDVVEFVCPRGGDLSKARTPALRGDIPPAFSPAGVALEKSRATWDEDGRRVRLSLAMSDLYPFVHAPGKPLRVFVQARAGSGATATWGSGWGEVKRPSLFGRLLPSGGGRILADTGQLSRPFQDAALKNAGGTLSVEAKSGARGAGASFVTAAQPGSRLTFTMKARGNATVNVTGWAFDSRVRKSSRERHDAGAYPLTPEWQELAGCLVLPPHADTVDFTVFSWRQPSVRWEIKDFKLVND